MTEKKKLSPPPVPPKISVNLGYTSTWDFQSVRVDIGLTDHVRAEETPDQALDRIHGWAERSLMTKLASTKSEVESTYVKKPQRRTK